MSKELILMADVDGLGVEGKVVKVADGYARNYLVPHKLAVPVTHTALRRLEKNRIEREARQKRDLEGAKALAETIAWGIEHHVYPYNHTFRHPHLDRVAAEFIQPQLSLNDQKLREYLVLAGHPEYASMLSNYIALPYGSWPGSDRGVEQLISYLDPEGDPVRAVFEAGYEYTPAFASPAFADGFDPMHLPRMAAIPSVIRLITEKAATFPSAESCTLTVTSGSADFDSIMAAIQGNISSGNCPSGIYVLDEGVFIARDGTVVPFNPGN